MTKSKHKTVKVKYRTPHFDVEGKEYTHCDIDEKLAPLIKELWRLNFDTCQCCEEEYPGLATIDFLLVSDVTDFLNMAGREYRVEAETWGDEEDGWDCRLTVLIPTADISKLVSTFRKVKERE